MFQENATGRYGSDYGLTAEQISNAKINAESLNITILSIMEENTVFISDLKPFGIPA